MVCLWSKPSLTELPAAARHHQVSSGDGYVGELLSGIKRIRTFSRLKRQGGISFKMLQGKRALSRTEERIYWFFLGCGRILRVPLELRLVSQGPTRVASGKSSLHASCQGPLGIPFQLVLRPRYSSDGEARTSGSSPVLTWI